MQIKQIYNAFEYTENIPIIKLERLDSGSGHENWLVYSEHEKYHVKCIKTTSPQIDKYIKINDLASNQLTSYNAVLEINSHQKCVSILRSYIDGEHYSYTEDDLVCALDALIEIKGFQVNDVKDLCVATYADQWMQQGFGYLKQTYDIIYKYQKGMLAMHFSLWQEILDEFIVHANNHTHDLVFQHGDFHGRNLIYKQKNLVDVIDWDEAGFSRYPVDLGKALCFLCRRGRGDFLLDAKLVLCFLGTMNESEFIGKLNIKFIFLIGALYFIPTKEHMSFLKETNEDKFNWYISWVKTFWDVYHDNLAIIGSLVDDG